MIEDWKTQLVIKKLTDTMLPDGWVYCVKGQHFVKKEDALMDDFDNPIEGQTETGYFCYKHYGQMNSIFNYGDRGKVKKGKKRECIVF
jgi:hypothetical protein